MTTFPHLREGKGGCGNSGDDGRHGLEVLDAEGFPDLLLGFQCIQFLAEGCGSSTMRTAGIHIKKSIVYGLKAS
jgi:hypothetical protein